MAGDLSCQMWPVWVVEYLQFSLKSYIRQASKKKRPSHRWQEGRVKQPKNLLYISFSIFVSLRTPVRRAAGASISA